MGRLTGWLYVLLLVLAVLCTAYWTQRLCEATHPRAVMPAPAPEIVQRDGSVVPEVRPDPSPAKPPHIIPRGMTETRRVTATVKPAKPDRSPIDLTLSLVEDDKTQRAVLSGEGGEIVASLDQPIRPFLLKPVHPWAVGPGYGPLHDAFGVRLDYDLHPRVRLSVDGTIGDFDGDGRRREAHAMVWALWRFGG